MMKIYHKNLDMIHNIYQICYFFITLYTILDIFVNIETVFMHILHYFLDIDVKCAIFCLFST